MKVLVVACFLLTGVVARAADYPAAAEGWPSAQQGDFILRDFHFRSGQTLAELKLHYRTIGHPVRDNDGVVRNAVLILHGTTGSGGGFLRPEFAGELFGKGQLLDGEKYYLILPDDIGHGRSSKPSDGMHARFPRYGYLDMIEAEHRLVVEGLKVNHLRLVIGTSMGGMHTWMWGETYPDLMDALMPLASLPDQIAGRNRLFRKTISDAIRSDPEWKNGEYKSQPHGLVIASELGAIFSGNPRLVYEEAPTLAKADELWETTAKNALKSRDANDLLYAWESSYDYDPSPGLEKIEAPLVAVNTADDLINPPDLGILEKQIKRVKRGKAVVIPEGPETRGHGTHSYAAVWKEYLAELMKESER